MIIDKRLAIVGGRNLADEYFGLDETVNFRDMELMVGGPVINGIADTFDNYWNDQWSFPIEEIIQFKPSSLKSEDHRLSARPHSQIHEEINQQSLIESFSMLVKDAYQGKVKVIADDPPGDDPADESSAPVQLANSLESYFNQARENIVLVSAYLIPAEDIENHLIIDEVDGVTDIDDFGTVGGNAEVVLNAIATVANPVIVAEGNARVMYVAVERASANLSAMAAAINSASAFANATVTSGSYTVV